MDKSLSWKSQTEKLLSTQLKISFYVFKMVKKTSILKYNKKLQIAYLIFYNFTYGTQKYVNAAGKLFTGN